MQNQIEQEIADEDEEEQQVNLQVASSDQLVDHNEIEDGRGSHTPHADELEEEEQDMVQTEEE